MAEGDPYMTAPVSDAPVHALSGPAVVATRWESLSDLALQRVIAILVGSQAAVVGLQVIARHVLRQPIPWTEEIARLLLVWLMCAGGIAAVRHGTHPRVTALVRLLSDHRRR